MLIKHANSSRIARDALVLDLGDIAAQGEMLRVQASQAAEKILREARDERTRTITTGKEEGFANGREQGLKEGHAEGVKAGTAKSFAEQSQKLTELSTKWEAALATFEASRDELLSDARASLLNLAVQVAQRIVKDVVRHDPGCVERQLEAALRMVLSPSRLRIAVHPDSQQVAGEALPQLMKKLSLGNHAEVAADPALAAGSCIVRTERGEIDASIGTQMDELVRVLLGGKPEESGAGVHSAATPAATEESASGPPADPGQDAAP